MFSLPTIPKILLIAAVILAVWWFFRRGDRENRSEGGAGQKKTTGKGGEKRIEDMVKCSKCGAYVPAGSSHCGKDGCPF